MFSKDLLFCIFLKKVSSFLLLLLRLERTTSLATLLFWSLILAASTEEQPYAVQRGWIFIDSYSVYVVNVSIKTGLTCFFLLGFHSLLRIPRPLSNHSSVKLPELVGDAPSPAPQHPRCSSEPLAYRREVSVFWTTSTSTGGLFCVIFPVTDWFLHDRKRPNWLSLNQM